MASPARAKLRRPRKEEAIISDIVGQIRAGDLTPGDRLASIKDLCSAYKVSQRIVDSAIGELVKRGIVVTRHRRGCFITTDAPRRALLDDAAAPPPGDAPAPAAARPAMTEFLVPRAGKRTLTLFTSEIMEPCMRVWSQLTDSFARQANLQGVELLCCQDGHVEEVMSDQHVDVVVSTPLILETMGADRFLHLEDYSAFGLEHADLLPLVQQRLATGRPTLGVPFQITLPYLFVNLELAASVGLADYRPDSLQALMDTARGVDARLRAVGARALTVANMHDYLMGTGAVSVDRDGRIAFDEARSRDILGHLHGSGLPTGRAMQVVDDFAAGKLLYLRHCSYEVIEIAQRAAFPWRVLPLPHPDHSVDPCWITVVGINRQTPLPQESIDLVRFLVSHEAQMRLSQLHSNHSAQTAICFHPDVLADGVVDAATLRRIMASCTLEWPESRWISLSNRISMPHEAAALSQGQMSVDDAISRLKVYLAFDG